MEVISGIAAVMNVSKWYVQNADPEMAGNKSQRKTADGRGGEKIFYRILEVRRQAKRSIDGDFEIGQPRRSRMHNRPKTPAPPVELHESRCRRSAVSTAGPHSAEL